MLRFWRSTYDVLIWSGSGRPRITSRSFKLTHYPIAISYRIRCDPAWRVRKLEVAVVGEERRIALSSDGGGKWFDASAVAYPQLTGAIDIDISATPFTNTLPIRRLGLERGTPTEILVVYILMPALEVTTDRQRYTKLDWEGRRYRYESVDSDFTRDIEVDEHGLVVTYPGLFRRLE
jgi:uncharacterized protein